MNRNVRRLGGGIREDAAVGSVKRSRVTLGGGGCELIQGPSFRGLSIRNKCHLMLQLHVVSYLLSFGSYVVVTFVRECECEGISLASQESPVSLGSPDHDDTTTLVRK